MAVGRNIRDAVENECKMQNAECRIMEKIKIKNQKIGVSQKAILFNENGKILTIRRTKTAPSRPLYWDLPGGDLYFGEEVKEGITREIKEETGLEVQDLLLFDVISGLNDKNEFWVTICYIARPITVDVVLSYEHDDFKWVTPNEFQKLKVSPRNKKFVKNVLNYIKINNIFL
ncbi:NUDIX hydrolase [Candidatus Kuenenbacteria bacterium]|nr:NUDIX hydrolase [Candidatus Kuenenbacteria bacterium]